MDEQIAEQSVREIMFAHLVIHGDYCLCDICKDTQRERLKALIKLAEGYEKKLALIASEQAEHDIEVADVAFDKGFDVGKTEAKIEAEAKYKPMVEALKEAKKQILHIEDKSSKAFTSTDMVLAKIDAALPKGEGK